MSSAEKTEPYTNFEHLIAERDAEIERLTRELEHFEKSCIVEVAVRNPQVAEYVKHWEGRAEKAEARVVELEAALREIEEETRPNGSMADQAVNQLARAALASTTPQEGK